MIPSIPVDPERRRQVGTALLAVLPERCVLLDPEDTRPCECDGLAAYRQMPMAVTLPGNEEADRTALEVAEEISRMTAIAHLQSGTGTPVRHWIELIDRALAGAPAR